MVTPQQHADIALAEWHRLRELPPKERVLVVICNSIINDEKVRLAAPLAVEMLEAEMRRYRDIQAAVAEAVTHA